MKEKITHPKGLYLLFLVEMWERFSYYGMRGILILYLTKTIAQGGLAFSESLASHIYGAFTAFLYAAPLAGGYIADQYWGKRKAISVGSFFMMTGQFLLFLWNTPIGLCLGLILLAFGNGFFKPNISSLLGDLYTKDDPRKDAAFSIFYMGINIGAFLSPLIIGLLAEDFFAIKNEAGEILSYGYRYGFLASGIGMVCSQLIFSYFGPKFLGDAGYLTIQKKENNQPKTPLTKEEKDRILAIFVICIFVIAFWTGFEQAGASITLYTDKFIDRNLLGWQIPTVWFQAVNALFVITLAPVMAMFWMTKWGTRISTPQKMAMGLLLLGLGFLSIYTATLTRGDSNNELIKANMLWVIVMYFLHTLGELSLSPVGLSVVTKLSPAQNVSFFMGVWFLASAIANWCVGLISALVSVWGASTIFLSLMLFSFFCGFLLLTLSKKISFWMHGIH